MAVHILKYTEPKMHGSRVEINPLAPGIRTERHLQRCAHCERYWLIQPGSGTKRGWCLRCNAATCNENQACATTCTPWEREFDRIYRRERLWEAVERTRGL